MAKKSTSVSLIVFGILFVALGVFLFSAQSGSAVVLIVAALDAIFGVALAAGGIKGLKRASDSEFFGESQYDSYEEDYQDEQRDYGFSVSNDEPVEYESEEYDEPVDRKADLAAREGELRAAAKQAAEEAARAKKVATDAIAEAKRAEEELSRAESELAQLSAVEQRVAMRQIDALAQVAAEKSEIAVRETHKAKLAIKDAREAAELHSRAMDAAAEAMAASDEFDEFN